MSDKQTPHHPHDTLFKKSMEHPSVAIDLLESYLPKAVLSKIDLSTLKQQKESFIEKSFGKRTVDCLYQVEFKSEKIAYQDEDCKAIDVNAKNTEIGYVYLLLEQQTKPEKFMGLRLVKYMISIMEYHRKKFKDDKYLPLIYPIVIHTGLGSYNTPTNILDLFKDKDLARMMMSEFFQLIDIDKISDEEMKAKLYAGSMMYVFKHRANRQIADIMELIKDNLNTIINEIGIDYPSAMLEYLINSSEADEIQTKKLIDIFIELATDKEDKETIMTIAERLEQKGIEKGILQGMEQGIERGEEKAIQKTAINMLKEGCNIDLIARVTGLNDDQLVRLKAKL